MKHKPQKNKTITINKKPSFSHDSFFKDFYSDPHLAQELLTLVFSKKELSICNLKKLKVEKDTFEGKRADLIFSIPFKRAPKIKVRFFILLEHKSSYDKNLFDQILDYQYLMRKHSIQQVGYPQPIIPILFYHGKEPMRWKKTLQEADFQSFFLKIPSKFKKIMLDYELQVIDTKSRGVRNFYKNKKIKGRGVIKLLSEIWSLKKARVPKVKEVFVGFKDILKEQRGKRKKEISLRILEYLFDNTDLSVSVWRKAEAKLIEEGILPRGGAMNIREHIKEKGRWEGQQEGRLQGQQEGRLQGQQEGRLQGQQERNKELILNMLKEKADIAFISKVTGLSEKEIKKLKNSS